MQNVLGNTAGAYLTAYIMGGGKTDANRAARYAFRGGVLNNIAHLTYSKIHGPPQNGKFVGGRRLNEGSSFLKRIGFATASILGVGHSFFVDVSNGNATTYELYNRGGRGVSNSFPSGDPSNSYYKFGNSFGTWFEPIDVIPNRPMGDQGEYGICAGSCNNWTY